MIPCGPIDVSVVKIQNIRWACPTEGKISRSRILINIEWSLIPYVQILIDITHGETRALTFMKALGVSLTHAKKKQSDSGSYIIADYNSSNFVHIVCITQNGSTVYVNLVCDKKYNSRSRPNVSANHALMTSLLHLSKRPSEGAKKELVLSKRGTKEGPNLIKRDQSD